MDARSTKGRGWTCYVQEFANDSCWFWSIVCWHHHSNITCQTQHVHYVLLCHIVTHSNRTIILKAYVITIYEPIAHEKIDAQCCVGCTRRRTDTVDMFYLSESILDAHTYVSVDSSTWDPLRNYSCTCTGFRSSTPVSPANFAHRQLSHSSDNVHPAPLRDAPWLRHHTARSLRCRPLMVAAFVLERHLYGYGYGYITPRWITLSRLPRSSELFLR